MLGRIVNASKNITIAYNKYKCGNLVDLLGKGAKIISYDDIKVVKVKNYGLITNDNQ